MAKRVDDPVALVDRYLELSAAGDLRASAGFLVDAPLLVWPGGRRYDSLAEARGDTGRRFRAIAKRRDVYDVAPRADGVVVVVSSGTLLGETAAGERFSGIRYLDRLVVRDGRIAEQHVFNDIAVSGLEVPS